MVSRIRLVGAALALVVAVGGFGVLAGGDATPAIAAPAVAAGAQAAAPTGDATLQPAIEKPSVDCSKQAWPYVARECLSAVEGTPARKVTRMIAVTSR